MRGSFKHQPGREKARENEPIVYEPVGDPPEEFNEHQLRAWHDIVTTAPAGVLTRADRVSVEMAAKLLANERLGTNSDSNGRRLDALLGKFGMNPSDRSKVSVSIPTAKPGNPFAKIS